MSVLCVYVVRGLGGEACAACLAPVRSAQGIAVMMVDDFTAG